MNQTTETTFGPAEYHVNADGNVWLSWPAGVTIHRVHYRRASVFGERNRGHVMLERERWDQQPTQAAYHAVREEHTRLTPLLATPERIARACVVSAESAVKYAERDRQQAEEKEAQARAALEEAREVLARLGAGGDSAA